MTATIKVQAVVPIAKPKNLRRPRMVPIAIDSSRKISSVVATIHWIVCIFDGSPGRFRFHSDGENFESRLIQINSGREWRGVYRLDEFGNLDHARHGGAAPGNLAGRVAAGIRRRLSRH